MLIQDRYASATHKDVEKIKFIKEKCIEVDGCWLWQGSCHKSTGNPSMGKFTGRQVMWKAANGDPEKGMKIMISCKNVNCLNPEHLKLGTVSEILIKSHATNEKPPWVCKKCGSIDRGPLGQCKQCACNRTKQYEIKNKDNIKKQRAEFRAKNKESLKKAKASYYLLNSARTKELSSIRYSLKRTHILEMNKKWMILNNEKVKGYKKKWEKKNPEHLKNSCAKRRIKIKDIGKLSKGLINKLYKLQGGKCPCCKKLLGNKYHADHKMPIALGGLNIDENIQLLRSVCNLKKGAKHPVDFMQSRGFLL